MNHCEQQYWDSIRRDPNCKKVGADVYWLGAPELYHVTKAKVIVEERIAEELGNVSSERGDQRMPMEDFLYMYDRIYTLYKNNNKYHTPKILLMLVITRLLKYIGYRSEAEIFRLQWRTNIKHHTVGRECKFVITWSAENKNKKGSVKHKENNSVTVFQSRFEECGCYEALLILKQVRPTVVKDDAIFPYPKHYWGYVLSLLSNN